MSVHILPYFPCLGSEFSHDCSHSAYFPCYGSEFSHSCSHSAYCPYHGSEFSHDCSHSALFPLLWIWVLTWLFTLCPISLAMDLSSHMTVHTLPYLHCYGCEFSHDCSHSALFPLPWIWVLSWQFTFCPISLNIDLNCHTMVQPVFLPAMYVSVRWLQQSNILLIYFLYIYIYIRE